MRTRLLLPLAAASLLLSACERAVTDPAIETQPSLVVRGTLAGTSYPAVVLLIADVDGRAAWSCSGTLLSPTVVLTAGHCVYPDPGQTITGIRAFTESDVDAGRAAGTNNFPNAGPNAVEAASWAAHPSYTAQTWIYYDVGVVVLSQPIVLPSASDYGVLPTVNQLDALRPGARTTFTAVGYGTQRIHPVKPIDRYVRMVAAPHLIQVNAGIVGRFSLLLSNNASTGGTCFGDSGGPNFLGTTNVIGGVTSFGLNGQCGGTGGVFRLDRQHVLDFVAPYLR